MTWTIGPSLIGLAAYSYPWRCGFAGAETDRVCTYPYTAEALIDRAAGFGMSAVEFPVTLAPELDKLVRASLETTASRAARFLERDRRASAHADAGATGEAVSSFTPASEEPRPHAN